MFRIPASLLPSNLRRVRWASLACVAAAVAVAGCGGGSKSSYFVPTQVIAFGDENSTVDTTGVAIGSSGTLVGLHYTMNILTTGTSYCTLGSAYPCTDATVTPDSGATFTAGSSAATFALQSNQIVSEMQDGSINVSSVSTDVTRLIARGYICSPSYSSYSGIWLQRMAYDLDSALNLGSSYCPLDSGNGVSHAAWGKKTATVVSEVTDAIASGEIKSGVLVTIFVGQHDILDEYEDIKTLSGTSLTTAQAAAEARLAALGTSLAGVIRAASGTGAKVLFVSVPNLALSPKIKSANAAADENGDLLKELILAFNNAMKSDLYDVSGHKIGLVDAFNLYTKVDDSTTSTTVRTMEPACKTAVAGNTIVTPDGSSVTSDSLTDQQKLLYCTTSTMVDNALVSASRWADATHFAPYSHYLLGTLAYNRVRDNF